jgi:hypothetical protein
VTTSAGTCHTGRPHTRVSGPTPWPEYSALDDPRRADQRPCWEQMDGSVVGRGCVALMMHVVYKGRALPLAWQVRKGKKGHFPEDLHVALVKQVQTLIPLGASVVLLGDGEFDGTTLQHTLQNAHWSYVVRTGSHTTVLWDGERFRCETVAACIKPGTLVALTDVHVTAAAYGPVRLLCCWAKGYQEPLHLITHIPAADEACRLYAKRFRIDLLPRQAKECKTMCPGT